jgi:hypothetical protein
MIADCLPHQSTLARPLVFAKTGGFDLRYRYHADYDWFLKILADPTIDVRLLNDVIGSFQLGGASSQLTEAQPEVYALQNQSRYTRLLNGTKDALWFCKRLLLRKRARLRDESRTASECVRSFQPAITVTAVRPRRVRRSSTAYRTGWSRRFRRHAGNADVVRQELAREKSIIVSLRTVERAVAPLRRELISAARATVRFETHPGEQLQIDFGERRVEIGGVSVKVHLFVATLCYSRRLCPRVWP